MNSSSTSASRVTQATRGASSMKKAAIIPTSLSAALRANRGASFGVTGPNSDNGRTGGEGNQSVMSLKATAFRAIEFRPVRGRNSTVCAGCKTWESGLRTDFGEHHGCVPAARAKAHLLLCKPRLAATRSGGAANAHSATHTPTSEIDHATFQDASEAQSLPRQTAKLEYRFVLTASI